MRHVSTTWAMTGMVVLASCASDAASPQLNDARQEVAAARADETARYNPSGLRLAEESLARAEQAHENDPGSYGERHYAYLAHRKAVQARAEADVLRHKRERDEAKSQYGVVLERRVHRVEQSKDELERDLSVTERELERTRGELSETDQDLAAARRARAKSEKERQEALQSLYDLADVREDGKRVIVTFAGNVLFRSDESEILPSAHESLEKLADALEGYDGEEEIVIEGHTDARGPEAYNLTLSRRRAEAVKTFLVARGVLEDKVRAVGRGEADPIAPNDTAEGRANNRRVAITLPSEVYMSMRRR